MASSSVHCRAAAAAGSIFLVSAPSFSLFAWAHRLSTLAWPSSTVAASSNCSGSWLADRAGRAGLAQEVWLGRPGSDKAARSTLQLWELKERRASRRARSNLASASPDRPSVYSLASSPAGPFARPRAFPEIIDLGVGGRPTMNEADYGATLTRQRTTSSSPPHQANLSLARYYYILYNTIYYAILYYT